MSGTEKVFNQCLLVQQSLTAISKKHLKNMFCKSSLVKNNCLIPEMTGLKDFERKFSWNTYSCWNIGQSMSYSPGFVPIYLDERVDCSIKWEPMLSEFVYFIGDEPLPPHIHVRMQIMDLMELWSNFAKKSVPISISRPPLCHSYWMLRIAVVTPLRGENNQITGLLRSTFPLSYCQI